MAGNETTPRPRTRDTSVRTRERRPASGTSGRSGGKRPAGGDSGWIKKLLIGFAALFLIAFAIFPIGPLRELNSGDNSQGM